MMKGKAIIIVVVGCFAITAEATIQPSFQGLGDLPGGEFWSHPYAASADGSVVVGYSNSSSGNEAFRWTQEAGMVGLGDLPGSGFYSCAWDVSADGTVIVGYGQSSASGSYFEAVRWENGEMVGLGDFPGGNFISYAFAISGDGSTIVGYGYPSSNAEAFRWTQEAGMVGLGDLPGGLASSVAFDVSANGTVIVGYGHPSPPGEAYRWEDLNGNNEVDSDEKLNYHPEFGLGDLPGGDFRSRAYAVSPDGSVVVGMSQTFLGYEAFRWEGGEMVGLGYLPGEYGEDPPVSKAYAVSADGTIVAGFSYSETDDYAFIWDADNGIRYMKDFLIDDYGLVLTGWTLKEVRDISPDGLTFVGYGIGPNGPEGWIATIPEPATLLLLGLGVVMLRRRKL